MNSINLRILLVEDNIDDAEFCIRSLKKQQLANGLKHLKDGEEALNYIFTDLEWKKANPVSRLPDIILLDINMPKVDGIEVLKKVKENDRTQSIFVVMLTSSNSSPDLKNCFDHGADSYIVKPFNLEKFVHAVKNNKFSAML
jgi:two-component system response regulator